MHIEVIRDINGLRRIGPEWEKFTTGARNESPFLHWVWYEALWANMNFKGWDVFILTAWEDGRLVGAAAMQSAARNLFGFKFTEYKGLEIVLTEMYSWLLPEDENMASSICEVFIDRLAEQAQGRYILTWKNAYLQHDSFRIFQRVLVKRKHFLKIRSERSPLMIHIPPESEDILGALTKKHKKTMKYKRKRYESMGGNFFNFNKPDPDISSDLERSWSLEALSWKGMLGSAIAQHPDLRRFLNQVALELVKKGRFVLLTMRHEDNLVAFSYCLTAGNTIYGMKTSFNTSYGKLSPGNILVFYLLEWARANGYKKIDMCGDSQEWKMTWSRQSQRAGQLCAISSGLPASALYFYRYGWKDWLKKHRSLIRLRDWWNHRTWTLMRDHYPPNSALDNLIIKLGRKFHF